MTPPQKPPAAERELPTPGPWALRGYQIRAANGAGKHVATYQVCAADGRLIAAAPELLSMLIDMCDRADAAAHTTDAFADSVRDRLAALGLQRLALPESRAGDVKLEPRCRYCNRMGTLYNASTARCCEISRESDHALDYARSIGAVHPLPPPPQALELPHQQVDGMVERVTAAVESGMGILPPPQALEESGEVCRECGGGGGTDLGGLRCPVCRGTGRTQAAKLSGESRSSSQDTGHDRAPSPETLVPPQHETQPDSQPHETGRSQGGEVRAMRVTRSVRPDIELPEEEPDPRDARIVELEAQLAEAEQARLAYVQSAQREAASLRTALATEKAARGETEKNLADYTKWSDGVNDALEIQTDRHDTACRAAEQLWNALTDKQTSLDAARALPAKWRLYGPKPISNGHTITECCAAELDAILNPSAPAAERGKLGDGT